MTVKFVFRADGIIDEHVIIRKMLCPLCESPVKLEIQQLLEMPGKPLADRMLLRCTNRACDNKIEALFYLPEDYDPAEEAKRIRRFFKEK